MNESGGLRPSLDTDTLSVPEAAAIAGLAGSPEIMALLSGWDKPKKSATQALREAQDNVVRQKIYHELSDPERIPSHTEVIFCIVQVSCNPGWRTKENYIADCSASLEYYNLCNKDTLSRSALRAPTVFSVLPLMDAQTVEMANSQREVTQLAFQLAASLPAKGVDVKAKDLFKFVKQYARDLRSITPIPVVNSYSSGGTFGFRFSPSYQALNDPAQKRARAANVLLPTTFPALITVILHHNDIRAAAREFKPGYHWHGPQDPLPEGFSVMTHVSTRWYLKDRPPLANFFKRLVTPMKRDTSAIEVGAAKDVADFWQAKDLYKQRAYLVQTEDGPARLDKSQVFDPVMEELRRSIIDLQSKGLGRSWPLDLGGLALSHMQSAGRATPPPSAAVKPTLEEQNKALLSLLKTVLARRDTASTAEVQAAEKAPLTEQGKAQTGVDPLMETTLSELADEHQRSSAPPVPSPASPAQNNELANPPKAGANVPSEPAAPSASKVSDAGRNLNGPSSKKASTKGRLALRLEHGPAGTPELDPPLPNR
jgi:hypothetical protein